MNSSVFQFGEDVDGYPIKVLNERAVRAAAGLLLVGAMVSFMNAMLLGNFQPTRFFVMVFMLDMAIWVVLKPAQHLPAMRLACLLLGSAAVLGTLRFSGVLPLPPLHQFVSMLGAGVGLPLLAIAVVWPHSAVATERRFTWIFAVIAAVICILLVLMVQF